MRLDGSSFAEKNTGRSKEPRYVIQVSFDTASTDLYYFTSHADAALPIGASSTASVVAGISGTSQKINPDKARSEIGAIAIELIDSGSAITALLASKLAGGDGLRDKRVRVYIGYVGHNWDDYVLIQTQIVRGVDYKDGKYKISCGDIQRSARKDIFDIEETHITSTVSESDTIVNVVTTTPFIMVAHGTSYSDAPSSTVGYIKIDDEVIRYTGLTSTSFTGCTRGVLNTKADIHEYDSTITSSDRATVVEEYIYLEMPALKMAYAILTGDLYGQASTIPDHWHLDINTDFVNSNEFISYPDLWDSTDDSKGVVLRFEGLEKQDAKKFVEEQLLFIVGCFMPVRADGALGVYKMSRVLGDAPFVARLDSSNVVSYSNLKHDIDSVINQINIKWNWSEFQGRYTRTNLLIDPESIAIHRLSKPLEIKARGIHGSRHTNTILATLFDFVRDRYAGPPELITIQCLPSLNGVEVGDILRLTLDQVRDSVSGGAIDRSFEVQNVRVDWITGNVSLKLFGSTQLSSEISLPEDAAVFPSGFYTSKGTPLSSVLTISGSPGHVTANGTITGDVDMNAAGACFYHDDDLIVDAGVEVGILDNVQLRINGTLTDNGDINGVGGGLLGTAGATSFTLDSYNLPRSTVSPGLPGFLGDTRPQYGVVHYTEAGSWGVVLSDEDNYVNGLYQSMPKINAVYNPISGDVDGLPTDMRGSSGTGGGIIFDHPTQTYKASGGDGGDGGAGLVVIAKSLAKGGSGLIDLSGTDGGIGGTYTVGSTTYYGGAGAGGAPGALLVILDGSGAIYPDMANFFSANYGHSKLRGEPNSWFAVSNHRSGPWFGRSQGYYGDGAPWVVNTAQSGETYEIYHNNDASLSAHRIHYIPEYTAPEEDTSIEVVPPPTGLMLNSGTGYLLEAADGTIISRIHGGWTAAVYPFAKGYRVEYKKSVDSDWLAVSSLTAYSTTEHYISDVEDGVDYDVRVKTISRYGFESEWLTVSSHNVVGKTEAPIAVDSVAVALRSDGDHYISWVYTAPPIDIGTYEILVDGVVKHSGLRSLDFISDTAVLKIPGTYTVGVKAVDTSGNKATITTFVYVHPNVPNVASYLLQRQPDGTREHSWSATELINHAGYKVRYILGSSGTWETMTPLHSGFLEASPFESNQLAAGTWTLAIKQFDTSGNESVAALFISGLVLDDPRIAGTIGVFDPRAAGWPGTKTDCYVDSGSGNLYATDTKDWSDFATDVVPWSAWNLWARSPSSPIIYQHTTIDVGAITTFIPLVTVTGNGTVLIEEQHSDDDISYSSWAATSLQITTRFLRVRATVTNASALADITQMLIVLSADPVSEDFEDLDTSTLFQIGGTAGHVKLPIIETYNVIKRVDVMLQGTGAGWDVKLLSKSDTVNGPEIQIYNGSGVEANAIIDATVRGV